MADFENNIFIKIEETGGSDFKTLSTAKGAVQGLNTELQTLVNLVTTLGSVDLDIAGPIQAGGAAGLKALTGEEALAMIDSAEATRVARSETEELIKAQEKLEGGLSSSTKALNVYEDAERVATETANKFGVAVKDVKVEVVKNAQGLNEYIATVKKANGSTIRYNTTLDKFKKIMVQGGPGGFIGRFTESIRDQTQEIVRVTGKVLLWTAATSAIFGAIRLLKSSVGVFSEFEQEMVALARVAQFDQAEVELLSQKVIDLSKQLGSNIIVSTEAATSLARLGLNAAEITSVLETALLAQNVAELEVNEATLKLISALKQFQLDMTASINILDQWNELSNKNAVTVSNLAEAVSVAGSVFNSFGADIEDLNSYITVLSEVTAKSGAQIGNALKTIASFAFRPETINTIERLTNIKVETETGELLELDRLLAGIAARFDDLTDAQKNELVTSIAGARQKNFLIALLNNFDDVLENNAVQFGAAGSAQEENIKVLDTYANRVERLTAVLDEAKISLGEAFVEKIAEVLPVLEKMIGALKDETVQASIANGAMISLIGTIGLVVAANAKAILSFKNLAVALAAVAASAIAADFRKTFADPQQYVKALDSARESVIRFGKRFDDARKQTEREIEVLNQLEETASQIEENFYGIERSASAVSKREKELLDLAKKYRDNKAITAEEFEELEKSSNKQLTLQKFIQSREEKRNDQLKEQSKLIGEGINKANINNNKLTERRLEIQEKISKLEEKSLLARRLEEEKTGESVKDLRKEEAELAAAAQRSIFTRIELQKQLDNLKSEALSKEGKQLNENLAIDKERRKELEAQGEELFKIFQIQLQRSEQRKTGALDIISNDELDKSVNRILILEQQIDSLASFISKTQQDIDDGKIIGEDAIIAQTQIEAAKKLLEDFRKSVQDIKKIDIPLVNLKKFVDELKRVTEETFFFKLDLAEEFVAGDISDRLQFVQNELDLQEKLLEVELEKAQKEGDINKQLQKTIQLQQIQAKTEENRVRLFQETLRLQFEKIKAERESIENARREALMLEDQGDVLSRLGDIEAIRGLTGISMETFLAFSPEQKKLLEQLRPDLFAKIAEQLGQAPKDAADQFSQDFETALTATVEKLGFDAFEQKIPEASNQLTEAAKVQLDAANIWHETAYEFNRIITESSFAAPISQGPISPSFLGPLELANNVSGGLNDMTNLLLQSQAQLSADLIALNAKINEETTHQEALRRDAFVGNGAGVE